MDFDDTGRDLFSLPSPFLPLARANPVPLRKGRRGLQAVLVKSGDRGRTEFLGDFDEGRHEVSGQLQVLIDEQQAPAFRSIGAEVPCGGSASVGLANALRVFEGRQNLPKRGLHRPR